jgi:phosphotransferase system IIA component
VGLDTVNLKGEHFTAHVKEGDSVEKGALLLEADLAAIEQAGYNTITPVLICNTGDFADVAPDIAGEVAPGACVLRIKLK